MSTYKICFYNEVDKKFTGCNLKANTLLDSLLIRVCAVIRSNTACSKVLNTLFHTFFFFA